MNNPKQPAALGTAEQNTGAVITTAAMTLMFLYLTAGIAGLDSEAGILLALVVSFVITVSLSLGVLYKYRKEQKAGVIDYLNVGTQRYILGVFMILYGIDKLLGNFFDYQLSAMDTKLADVSEFELAWFFYGKNRWLELFTGLLEFLPGILLFSRRAHYTAALVLLPVTMQVFMLNFFFRIGGITLPASAILLLCNLYIIYSRKEQVLGFFRSLRFCAPALPGRGARITIRLLKGAVIAIVLMLLFLKVRPAIFSAPDQRLYRQLVGLYSLKEVQKNGVIIDPAGDSNYYKDLYIEKQDRWNMLRRCNDKTDAFILQASARNNSVALYINKGGTGDGP